MNAGTAYPGCHTHYGVVSPVSVEAFWVTCIRHVPMKRVQSLVGSTKGATLPSAANHSSARRAITARSFSLGQSHANVAIETRRNL